MLKVNDGRTDRRRTTYDHNIALEPSENIFLIVYFCSVFYVCAFRRNRNKKNPTFLCISRVNVYIKGFH